jgi:hypothetical protein
MLDELGCRSRIPLAPVAGNNSSLEQPLDTTEPKLTRRSVGIGEGSGLDLDPPE